MMSVPPSTFSVEPLPIVPAPASVSEPPETISISHPLQERLRPAMGFGTALLTVKMVGEAFVSVAVSPVAQPGKPPLGVQSAPLLSAQLPVGGALPVTA